MPTTIQSAVGMGVVLVTLSLLMFAGTVHGGAPASAVAQTADADNGTPQDTPPNRTTAPRLLTKSPDGSTVYAALSGTDEILILNTTSDTVRKRISSYGDDPRDIEPIGNDRLLVANWGSGNVTVVDTSGDGGYLRKLDVGANPWAIETAQTANGTRAVVASWSGNDQANGTITFINTTSLTISEVIPIPSPNDGGPWGVATCPPPKPLYITNDGDDVTLQITLDPFSMEIVGKGELPWDAGCTPNPRGPGSILAIANGGLDSVGPADDPVIQHKEVDEGDTFIGWSFDFFNSLTADGQTQVQSLQEASLPPEFREDPDNDPKFKRVRKGLASLELIKIDDQGEFEERIEIPIGTGSDYEPWGAAWDDRGRAYFTDMHANVVYAVNGTSGEFVHNFSTGEAPRDSVVANGKLYVGISDTHLISTKGEPFDYTSNVMGPGSIDIFDLDTQTQIKRISLGPLDVTGNGEAATDTDGDGLLEDIQGDDDFDIFDVQAFLDNFKTSTAQDNAAKFDFDGRGGVDIFDVQALLDEYANRNN